MARIYVIDEGENPVHDPTVRARARKVRRARDRLLPLLLAVGMALSCGVLFSRVQIRSQNVVQSSISHAVQPPAQTGQRPWIEVFITPAPPAPEP